MGENKKAHIVAPAFVPLAHMIAARLKPIRQVAETPTEIETSGGGFLGIKNPEQNRIGRKLLEGGGNMLKNLLLGNPQETDKILMLNKKLMSGGELTSDEAGYLSEKAMASGMNIAGMTGTVGSGSLDDIATNRSFAQGLEDKARKRIQEGDFAGAKEAIDALDSFELSKWADEGKQPVSTEVRKLYEELDNAKTGGGVFRLKTGMYPYDDFINGTKGDKVSRVVYMSPDEYLAKIPESPPHAGSLAHFKKRLEAGKPLDMPSLDYSLGGLNQEGRNRAYFAKELGLEKIPVLIVDKVKGVLSNYAN